MREGVLLVLEDEEAEVLLVLARATSILSRTLPDVSEVRAYLGDWAEAAGAWAVELGSEERPLLRQVN